jgi:hypothetical protein
MEEPIRAKATVKPKITRNQEQAHLEITEFERSLEDPQSHDIPEEITHPATELLPKEQQFTLTASELSKIILASQGKTLPTTPQEITSVAIESKGILDKAQDTVDDTLSEIGKGLHRVADGVRDIAGGLIDIITLGRANRR